MFCLTVEEFSCLKGPGPPELMGMVQGKGAVLMVESLTAKAALQCREGPPLTLFIVALVQNCGFKVKFI